MWNQVTKLRFAYRKQENPFLLHILTTSEEPFRDSLYSRLNYESCRNASGKYKMLPTFLHILWCFTTYA